MQSLFGLLLRFIFLRTVPTQELGKLLANSLCKLITNMVVRTLFQLYDMFTHDFVADLLQHDLCPTKLVIAVFKI